MKKKVLLANFGCVLLLALFQMSGCLAFCQTIPNPSNDSNSRTTDDGLQLSSPVPISDKMFYAAQRAALNATPESLAALSDDDPLLKVIYIDHGLNHLEEGPSHIALVADMKRRGNVTIDILTGCFKNPYYSASRSHILHGIQYLGPWLKPDRFLFLARAWYSQTKVWNSDDTLPLVRFLSWAGQPEDEALMRELMGPGGHKSADTDDFFRRIDQIKKLRETEKKAQLPETRTELAIKASGPSHRPADRVQHENSSWNVPWVIGGACIAVIALVAWVAGRKK